MIQFAFGVLLISYRCTYTQVRPTAQISSSLTKQDNPTGRAAKIAHQWCVEQRVVVGIQKEDGTIARTNPLVIRRGDFVDVAVTLLVVTMRARKIRKTEVFFSPQEVVRLALAAHTMVCLEVLGVKRSSLLVAANVEDTLCPYESHGSS